MNRLIALYRTAARYQLDELLPSDQRPRLLSLILRIFPVLSVPANTPRGERLRRAMEDLGPVFIKFGQLLSTRRDLLPLDIADELAKLQDQVPPFPAKEAIQRIETALGRDLNECFAEFEANPLAAASVAQVHGARLPDGSDVVVKVLRPGIERVIDQDLKILRHVAKVLARWSSFSRLKPVEVVKEYDRIIRAELDLRREAANASQLKRHFQSGELVYVPEMNWSLTCEAVMVSERIYGVPVSDIDTLRGKQVDLKLLAERGVEIFFTQVFRDSFFHADMHPGNIFVDCTQPENPRYMAVDCAIVGQLDEHDLYYLARNLLAIFHQDYRLCAKLHIECGWVPHETPIAEFEAAMRTLCEPVFERPLEEISFAHMLVNLFRTAGQFDMQVQPQLVLLQKTLLNIEGLGRQLYPQLNLWDTAKPFLEKWLADRYSLQTVSKRLQEEAPALLETLPLLPDMIMSRLRQSTHPPPIKASAPDWILPLATASAFALGVGISASTGGTAWLLIGGGGLLVASIGRYR
ncbi:MAG: ubiquinone biosynthesis regulatory protein kinase UbiB [Luminiphilus sp.]|jgi:ubiquinone biosynthesis protein|nr:ubiquinone biosynthesis regulatory protein kinase UbiB [Luminiphilus sp.]